MDQLEKKVEGAKKREGRRRDRRKVWEEVNGEVAVEVNGWLVRRGRGGKEKGIGKVAIGMGDGQVGEEELWEDEDEDGNNDGDEEMKVVDGAELPPEGAAGGAIESPAPAVIAGEKLVVVNHTANLDSEDIDEIT